MFYNLSPDAGLLLVSWLLPMVIWEVIWKGIGMWKAGQNKQLRWFVAILIINTAGLLPIIYIVWFQKKHKKAYFWPKK